MQDLSIIIVNHKNVCKFFTQIKLTDVLHHLYYILDELLEEFCHRACLINALKAGPWRKKSGLSTPFCIFWKPCLSLLRKVL